MSEQCPRARSDMTPCVLKHGDSARFEDGSCVGCGVQVVPTNPPLDLDAIRTAAAGLLCVMPHIGTARDAIALADALEASRAEVERLWDLVRRAHDWGWTEALYQCHVEAGDSGWKTQGDSWNNFVASVTQLREVERE